MKKDIHPENVRHVIFEDSSTKDQWLILSTVNTEETAKWSDGKEYPLYRVEISSASHPFFTGQERVMDTAGRVDKFRRRQEAAKEKASGK
ncbi:MAG: type B 50S ribosomal protein L31 [Candidatus Campbellbacteria bacterium]|nr:type B 50S ribosomal protein L31 [Candidatus Campbellbacteria bacterium]